MKKINLKKTAAAVLSLIMVFGMASCGTEDTDSEANGETAETVDYENSERIKEIKEKGKLVVGTSADYAPFEFHTKIDGEDTIVGFDIAIAQKIADSLGVELEVVDMAFDSLLISLDNGDFDMVIASLGATEERKEAVDFSEPYHQSTHLAVVRTEDAEKYSTAESLKGQAVAAQKGATLVPEAEKLAGAENVVQLVKVNDMVTELLNGKVEAIILDSVIAYGYEAINDELTAVDVGLEPTSDGECIACQKGDADLVGYINEVIAGISEDEINQMLLDAQILAGIIEEE